MNYLAHCFLSRNDDEIIGNIIGDFVKNRDKNLLPESVQNGVFLHRKIDTFTDAHPVVQEAKKVFNPLVRLYSGAFLDIAFDYFLANDHSIKSVEEWKVYNSKVYNLLQNNFEILPEKFRIILPNMIQNDWLTNYRFDWGIEKSFSNLLRKAKYLDDDLPVFEIFLEQKQYLRSCYEIFFPDLCEFAKNSDKDNGQDMLVSGFFADH